MTTLYAALLAVCGLSQREAAELHRSRIDTVKSWCAGRNRAPLGVLAELVDLHRRQRRAADEAAAEIARVAAADGAPEMIELGLVSDDEEARSLGWPCASAQAIVVGMTAAAALERGFKVALVPRGSTPATAAAADAHEAASTKRC